MYSSRIIKIYFKSANNKVFVDGKELSLHLKNNFIVLVIVIFTAIFPLFIIGVEAQPPIKVGEDPEGIAYKPDNKKIYVSNTGDDTVSAIDTATNTVVGTIPVGDGPSGIEYDPLKKRMYVTNSKDHTVVPIHVW